MFGSIHSITPFRRRLSFAAGGALALLALAGCSTTASVSTPVSSTTISSAVTAGYNELCVGSASSPSLLTVAETVPLNAQRQADLTTLQQICQRRPDERADRDRRRHFGLRHASARLPVARAQVSFLESILGALGTIMPAAPLASTPLVTVGPASLTGAQVRALFAVASHLVEGTATVADEETVADTVIAAALTAAGPAAALAAPAATLIANLAIEAIADGDIKITPGAPGEGQMKASAETHGLNIGR